MDFKSYMDYLEDRLRNSFDLYKEHTVGDVNFDLYARYYIKSERFFLVKKAKIYGMENNEHILLRKHDFVNRNTIETFANSIISAIDELVVPHPEHMSSFITGVLVVDDISTADGDISDFVKKFKYHKGFSFGLRGWVDVRLLIVSLKDGIVISNKKGEEVLKLYKVS